MPFLKIHVPASLPKEKKSALLSQAHQALNRALKLDPPKGQVVLYESVDRLNAPGRPDDFVYAEVSLFAGRAEPMKDDLLAALSRAIQDSLGTPEAEVQVNLLEYEKRHWAIAGKPASRG